MSEDNKSINILAEVADKANKYNSIVKHFETAKYLTKTDFEKINNKIDHNLIRNKEKS